jgi:hypothetical protein
MMELKYKTTKMSGLSYQMKRNNDHVQIENCNDEKSKDMLIEIEEEEREFYLIKY